MRAVIFEHAPEDIEFKKERLRDTVVAGTYVYLAAATRAMFTSGTYDRYFAFTRGAPGEFSLVNPARTAGCRARLEPLSLEQVGMFSASDEIVFFTDRPILNHLFVPVRNRIGRPDASIVGMIHALQGDMTPLIRMILEGELHEHDAIMCSSTTGRQGFMNIVNTLCDRLERTFGVRTRLPLQLPVIPLGVDASAEADTAFRAEARRQAHLDPETVQILYFGRLSSLYKGDLVPLLIAFARCLPSQVRLCLAGDDAQFRLAPMLGEIAQELGVASRVTIVTDTSPAERRRLLAAADVFVSPSDNLQETFGITIVEAMAAGLPVVASDWDGYRDLVSHGRTGFLVPTVMPRLPRTLDVKGVPYGTLGIETLAQTTSVDVLAMASFLQTLAQQPALRRRMGDESRAEARRRFDWPVIVRQYEDLWAALRERARSPASPVFRTDLFEAPFYQDVFGHYPARFLDDADVLDIGELGEILDGSVRVRAQLVGPSGLFTDGTFRRIVGELTNNGPMSVGALEGALAENGDDPAIVRAHVSRLIKYGGLRIPQPVACA